MTRPLPHITGYDPEGALHVLRNLAPLDRIEAFDLMPTDDAMTLFALYQLSAPSAPVFHVVRPRPLAPATAILGLSPTTPGMGRVHMLATDALDARTTVHLAARIRRGIGRAMAEAGLHRVDCACLESHGMARAFLHRAGATFEATLHHYGKSRSNYRQYTWTRGDDPCA